ncbi:MAG: serine/threonine-protein kinase [Betaproteobacteria bacterium]|jgi:serine/threonine protein kinase
MERIGKYEIIRELGRGATSAVFLAHDPFAGRLVAVKVAKPETLSDAEYGRRFEKLFLAEASLAGRVHHPHIVRIHDAVADERSRYIVMEYVDGSTLEDHCRMDNLLPVRRVIELAFKCAKALDYAHRLGIIHRDIKPANILLATDGEIRISDFGAALSLGGETTQVTGVGSPAYMSPEQVRDQPLNHQTDIFSLGVVMYQLLTGRLPFKATNNFSMVYQIINVDPPPPSAYRPGVPKRVDVIVKKALQKSLDRRYAGWGDFAAALASVFNHLDSDLAPVAEAEQFHVLRGLLFFRNFSDIELWQVVRISKWSKHTQNARIIQEGEAGRSFFIIASGQVEVAKRGKVLTKLGTGECFGEMGYLGTRDLQRSASVTALEDVTLIEIRGDALSQATEDCRNRFNNAFLELLVSRLEEANVRVSQLLTERNIRLHSGVECDDATASEP